jgi:hypothetical protein
MFAIRKEIIKGLPIAIHFVEFCLRYLLRQEPDGLVILEEEDH